MFLMLGDTEFGQHVSTNNIPGPQESKRDIIPFLIIMGWVQICIQERKTNKHIYNMLLLVPNQPEW